MLAAPAYVVRVTPSRRAGRDTHLSSRSPQTSNALVCSRRVQGGQRWFEEDLRESKMASKMATDSASSLQWLPTCSKRLPRPFQDGPKCHAMICKSTQRDAMQWHAMLCNATQRYAMLPCAQRCTATQCYAMLSNALQWAQPISESGGRLPPILEASDYCRPVLVYVQLKLIPTVFWSEARHSDESATEA